MSILSFDNWHLLINVAFTSNEQVVVAVEGEGRGGEKMLFILLKSHLKNSTWEQQGSCHCLAM